MMMLGLLLLAGADGGGVDAMPPWVQAGGVVAFAALVYYEVRKIRDRIDEVLSQLAGETISRRRKRDSDRPPDTPKA